MSAQAADHTPDPAIAKRVLGIEGGGTKTEWVIAQIEVGDAGDSLVAVENGRLSASNMQLTSDTQLAALFSVMPADVTHVGAYLAACGDDTDRARLHGLLRQRWPLARLSLGSDRECAFAAAFHDSDGIVVIAGTGAVVHGRLGERTEKAGGWGQLLGDRGSGYHLAMQGLRHVLAGYDLHGEVSPTAQTILRSLALNRVPDLVEWVSGADKMSVARVAPAIFEAARLGDEEMLAILRSGATILAEYTQAVARRLGRDDLPVQLFGGIFAHNQEYGVLYREALRPLLPKAVVGECKDSGALGAAWLAAQPSHWFRPSQADATALPAVKVDAAELAAATTEQRNERSSELDRLATPDLVRLFIEEEHFVQRALADSHGAICRAVDLVSEALRRGGRLFYVGAGTSGRLGVLDASEIPPTFGAPPEIVQGIIAGGAVALHRAVEGAEDEPAAGALSIVERGVTSQDVVCGIAASGRTPFVIGALTRAREVGAKTILLTCNPARRRTPNPWAVEIDLPTGPELVTGSTRLKAGTATKLVLNILSTCAMIRMGKVRGNLMINVQISNAKLRDRGVRLVRDSLGISEQEAASRLAAAGWDVPACLAAKP